MEQRLNTFSQYCRQNFGETIGKIPFDLGYPCPNRKRGGCIFCHPQGFAPAYLSRSSTIEEQLEAGRKHHLRGRFSRFFAYFQQETPTAVSLSRFIAIATNLISEKDCVGLIIATRPDYISEEFLKSLAHLVAEKGKKCLFELGIQSSHEKSLSFLNRNHSFNDAEDAAVRILRYRVFELGAHLLMGIPGEHEDEMVDSITKVCALGVTHLKIHHLQILHGTVLAEQHLRKPIRLFSEEGYYNFLIRSLPFIPANIVLHRLWATSHPDLLLAPCWHSLPGVLSQNLQKKMMELGVRQGSSVRSRVA